MAGLLGWRGLARCLTFGALAFTALLQASADDAWQRIKPGTFVLFRHALAPGTADPVGFSLGDCATQRNLSAEGRAQALRIGAAFERRRIAVETVWSSQWCRTRQTADLAFPGQRVDQAAFNSFFDSPAQGSRQTQAALALMAASESPGVTVVLTHQVNITALTGIVPDVGEGVVLRVRGAELSVLGRIQP